VMYLETVSNSMIKYQILGSRAGKLQQDTVSFLGRHHQSLPCG